MAVNRDIARFLNKKPYVPTFFSFLYVVFTFYLSRLRCAFFVFSAMPAKLYSVVRGRVISHAVLFTQFILASEKG